MLRIFGRLMRRRVYYLVQMREGRFVFRMVSEPRSRLLRAKL